MGYDSLISYVVFNYFLKKEVRDDFKTLSYRFKEFILILFVLFLPFKLKLDKTKPKVISNSVFSVLTKITR